MPPDTDFGELLPDVARRLYQDRTMSERGDDLRIGNKGSLVVHVDGPRRGTWHDFELGESGGTLKLIERELRTDRAGALRWLEDARLLAPSAPRRSTPPRTQSSPITRPPDSQSKSAQETSAHNGPRIDRGDQGGTWIPPGSVPTADLALRMIEASIKADSTPARPYLVRRRIPRAHGDRPPAGVA